MNIEIIETHSGDLAHVDTTPQEEINQAYAAFKAARRNERRSLAAQWREYRSAIELLQEAGFYQSAAVLRGHMILTAKVWGHYRAGRL